jgi:hypothetical protein
MLPVLKGQPPRSPKNHRLPVFVHLHSSAGLPWTDSPDRLHAALSEAATIGSRAKPISRLARSIPTGRAHYSRQLREPALPLPIRWQANDHPSTLYRVSAFDHRRPARYLPRGVAIPESWWSVAVKDRLLAGRTQYWPAVFECPSALYPRAGR